MAITQGSMVTEKGSREVQDIQDVMDAYIKVKKLHPCESHILCAFRLADRNDPTLHDYEDDGEHGGGRTMLKIPNDKDLTNKAIYIVRNYGKIKLFDMPFKLIAQVSLDALARKDPMQNQRRKRKATRSATPSVRGGFQGGQTRGRGFPMRSLNRFSGLQVETDQVTGSSVEEGLSQEPRPAAYSTQHRDENWF